MAFFYILFSKLTENTTLKSIHKLKRFFHNTAMDFIYKDLMQWVKTK